MKDEERARKFRRGCAVLIDAPLGYEWGKENLNGADCSGVVCHGLFCAGFKIRTTAHRLHHDFGKELTYVQMSLRFNKGMFVAIVETQNSPTLSNPFERKRHTTIHISPFITHSVLVEAHRAVDAILPLSWIDWENYYQSYRRNIRIIELDPKMLRVNNFSHGCGDDVELLLEGLNYDNI